MNRKQIENVALLTTLEVFRCATNLYNHQILERLPCTLKELKISGLNTTQTHKRIGQLEKIGLLIDENNTLQPTTLCVLMLRLLRNMSLLVAKEAKTKMKEDNNERT